VLIDTIVDVHPLSDKPSHHDPFFHKALALFIIETRSRKAQGAGRDGLT